MFEELVALPELLFLRCETAGPVALKQFPHLALKPLGRLQAQDRFGAGQAGENSRTSAAPLKTHSKFLILRDRPTASSSLWEGHRPMVTPSNPFGEPAFNSRNPSSRI